MTVLIMVAGMAVCGFVFGCGIGYAIGKYDGTEDGYNEFLDEMAKEDGNETTDYERMS